MLLLLALACDIDVHTNEDGTKGVTLEVDEEKVDAVKDKIDEKVDQADLELKAGDNSIKLDEGRVTVDNGERQIEAGNGEGVEIRKDGKTVKVTEDSVEATNADGDTVKVKDDGGVEMKRGGE